VDGLGQVEVQVPARWAGRALEIIGPAGDAIED